MSGMVAATGAGVKSESGRCEISSFMMAVGPSGMAAASGTARAFHQCTTHHMPDIVVIDGMCPIGRVEDAADKAIARIEAARG